MPTIPKLAAGIYFALLAWFCSDQVRLVLPDGFNLGWFREVSGAIGFYAGWFMSGSRAGDGTRAGLGYGLTSSVLIVFWGVLIFAGYEMLQNSLSRRYDGAIEAVQSMFQISMDYLVLIATPGIIGPLVVGGLFGGWLTEWFAKRWS
jgi:hypothetical protein